jgi:hypothetical protein
MSKARNLSDFISDATVDSTEIADLSVTHAKLHTDMNLSSKTLTFAANQISGNSVDGGVISNFASTGIDDNASATAVTILSDGKVGIGVTSPDNRLVIASGSDGTGNGDGIAFYGSVSNKQAAIESYNVGGYSSDLRFYTGDKSSASTTVTERMRIDSSGNVGIFGDGGVQTIDHYNNYTTVTLNNTTGSTIQFETAGAMVGEIFNATDNLTIGTTTSGASLRFRSGVSDEAMRIDSSGNVGIGISPTHLLHVQAGSTGNGDVKIGGGAGLLISHNNSGATVQTIKSLYHATSASSNLRIVTGFLTVSTGTSDTERLRLKSNGSFEIGYAGAALQQADSQAMTITTPASGGGQGIAIKRLDSNSDQQIGEITFSNNTQDGQAGIRVKTQGAVNTTDMHFDVNNSGGAVTSALKIDGSQGGKISIVSREMSIQGMELRHGTFGIGNYNRRVEIQLGNYESAHVRIMAQRTNGGSCLVYWEGYINNNNNAGYSTTIASRTSDGTVSYSFSNSGGNYRWDFNASGSSGDGSFVVQGARGGGSINITTW